MQATAHAQGHVSDDLVHEPEEPPDDMVPELISHLNQSPGFIKQAPRPTQPIRRESLLTRQLQPKDIEQDAYAFAPAYRVLSTTSTAELTSDNELTSPGTHGSSPSPPFHAIGAHFAIPPIEKPVTKEVIILAGNDDPEQKVESGLGRRRCITFACGKKAEAAAAPKPKEEQVAPPKPAETPARKSMITFNCPMRARATPPKPLNLTSRHLSPAPPKMHKSPKSPRHLSSKSRRDSDMTVTALSPETLRKPVLKKEPSQPKRGNKYADDADEEKLEAKRFHEFAVNSKADEEWTEEATCHRQRLTIKDTLHKENVIRQMAEEAAEEEADEEDDLDDDALLEDLDEDEDEDEDDDLENDEDEDDEDEHPSKRADDSVSEGGFDTDDEQGFANSSDSEDDSEFEWWVPGRSTAATSPHQLDTVRPLQRRASDSSLESAREANGPTLNHQPRQKTHTRALKINRAPTPELPDSTDFVCGTLDEDRPLEQAYKNCIAERKAAKHKVTPQDFDPTFPTSDPEMDEEDEEDEVEERGDDDQPLMLHGPMEFHDERGRRNPQAGVGKKKSKSPPLRLKSPAPLQHDAPIPRRKSLRSPPPPTKHRHRSPAPKKLFGHSPRRMRSPAPNNRPQSPPPSVQGTPRAATRGRGVDYLASRPAPTRVSSLPRVTTATKLHGLAAATPDDDDEDDNGPQRRVRGAIDIVKGLERKRMRRKEKLYQKYCHKMKKEGERKPKPGKGAERMRELGLELAAYRGKTAEHMLSV